MYKTNIVKDTKYILPTAYNGGKLCFHSRVSFCPQGCLVKGRIWLGVTHFSPFVRRISHFFTICQRGLPFFYHLQKGVTHFLEENGRRGIQECVQCAVGMYTTGMHTRFFWNFSVLRGLKTFLWGHWYTYFFMHPLGRQPYSYLVESHVLHIALRFISDATPADLLAASMAA